jgi:hypothetical protein
VWSPLTLSLSHEGRGDAASTSLHLAARLSLSTPALGSRARRWRHERGTSPVEFGQDRFKDAIDVRQYVIVPEADDREAVTFETSRAYSILLYAFSMLTAVNLDDELRLETAEIDRIWRERHLPAKLRTDYASIAQFEPQQPFSVGRTCSQLTGTCNAQ